MTKHSRRQFILNMTSLAALGFLPRSTTAATLRQHQFNFANKSLGGGMYAIGEITNGGNVLAIPTEEGAILVDSKFAHTAPDLAADVSALATGKAALLINTHHHADHSGGNWHFSESAKIVAHKNFNARIRGNLAQYAQQAQHHADELARTAPGTPKVQTAADLAAKIRTMTEASFIAKQELPDGVTTLTHGGVEIQCHHFGVGHTDNDIVVFLPKQNIMHVGDLLFHECHPFIDRNAKADTRAWQNVLRKVTEMTDESTVIIPGHGRVTDKTALIKQIEYFDRVREIVGKAITQGQTRDEIAAMKPEAFAHYALEVIQPITLRGIYDELLESKATPGG